MSDYSSKHKTVWDATLHVSFPLCAMCLGIPSLCGSPPCKLVSVPCASHIAKKDWELRLPWNLLDSLVQDYRNSLRSTAVHLVRKIHPVLLLLGTKLTDGCSTGGRALEHGPDTSCASIHILVHWIQHKYPKSPARLMQQASQRNERMFHQPQHQCGTTAHPIPFPRLLQVPLELRSSGQLTNPTFFGLSCLMTSLMTYVID
jgi:hypothetical protein